MATTKIKSTYSLDVDTVRALDEMAKRWGVPKSEALRRAIRGAATDLRDEADGPAAALRELRESVGLTRETTERWVEEIRAERQASPRQQASPQEHSARRLEPRRE